MDEREYIGEHIEHLGIVGKQLTPCGIQVSYSDEGLSSEDTYGFVPGGFNYTTHVRSVTCFACLRIEIERLRKERDTPELHNFVRAVELEAQHQRARWGSDHDAGKTPADWFWLVGYLAGKALHAQVGGLVDKALHHTVSTAAVLANWHAAILGKTTMRPGLGQEATKAIDEPGPAGGAAAP